MNEYKLTHEAQITFRVTEEEKRRLKASASLMGISLREYIHTILMNHSLTSCEVPLKSQPN